MMNSCTSVCGKMFALVLIWESLGIQDDVDCGVGL